MAQFTRTHGDFQPVMNYDEPTYTVGAVNAVTANETVQPQGPKLDFFTISAASGTTFSTTQVNIIFQTVQQLATIYIYEFGDASTNTLALAVYPTGAWAVDNSLGASANVVAAVNAALTAASVANTTTGSASVSFTN